MKAAPTSDALETLARQIKDLDEHVEVYVLSSAPRGSNADDALHVAVLAEVDDQRMSALSDALAEIVQSVNLDLDFDPFVIAHPTNRESTLARRARNDGVRI